MKFYCEVLGLRLQKTEDIGGGAQQFFFDIGNSSSLAYFWWPEMSKPLDGVSRSSLADFKKGTPKTAVGGMNHVAFAVDNMEALHRYRERLMKAGLKVPMLHHADSDTGLVDDETDPRIWVSSIYFFGPDGENLEMSVTERELGGARDIEHMPGGKAKLI